MENIKCNNCYYVGVPKSGFNGCIGLVLLIVFWPLALIYFIFCHFNKNVCPKCGSKYVSKKE